ncbi:hypothetical protein VHEMI10171 [[Torrubiella] hemipterigena]|nr:hypothetical protein VHEMI10171 [[Torrubiella] hemipterigena]
MLHTAYRVPTSVTLQLSKTALDIGHFVNQAARDQQQQLGASPSRLLAERLIRRGVERTVDALGSNDVDSSCLAHNKMLENINVQPNEVILAQTLSHVAESDSPSSSLLNDTQFTSAVERLLPKLYRQVENNADSNQRIDRLPGSKLQCLEFGKTRTVAEVDQLDLPEFAGEWLEAIDVEEYLAERGIIIRSDDPDCSQLHLQLGDTPTSGLSPSGVAWSLNDSENTEMDYYSPAGSAVSPSGDANKIIVNVDVLIECLAAKSMCLGLCPAIRRDDVDNAIRESIIQPDSVSLQ